MSAQVDTFDAALASVVMEALRADAGVRGFFGSPPRIFDDHSAEPIYPYVQLLSCETRDFAGVATPGGEHRITFAVLVRHGGQAEAAEGLNVLVTAINAANITLPGARIVLAHPVYLDVVRGKQPPHRRGLLRLRIVTEPEISS